MNHFKLNLLATSSFASVSSSSGWLGLFDGLRLSTGCTSPRPRYWAQTRLAMARAKNGFSALVIQSARASLRENFGFGGGWFGTNLTPLKSFGRGGSSSSGPSRNFGFTDSPLSPGLADRAGPVNLTSPVFFSPMA